MLMADQDNGFNRLRRDPMQQLTIGYALLLAFSAASSPANAASQDECAIWLCLPGGFPAGCSAAYAAMIERIEDRKPPLPDFGSCAGTSVLQHETRLSFGYGVAAYVPTRRVCVARQRLGNDKESCRRWDIIPQHYVKGTRCHADDGFYRPAGCTRTVRWAEVYINQTPTGATYYW